MERSLRVSKAHASAAGTRHTILTTAVGASYAFDPGADGLASIYAARVLDRGIDPRALCAEIRADRLGVPDRGTQRRALLARSRGARFGRGTAPHLRVKAASADEQSSSRVMRVAGLRATRSTGTQSRSHHKWSRKLVTAGLAALLLLPISVMLANAQQTPPQARYIVQPGDTLDGVAAEFGVDPAAILAASAIQDPPRLTLAETIVIPGPGESPDAAAWNAEQRRGASPFVIGVHEVQAGETLADIAGAYGLDPWDLAIFNGVADIDTLSAGHRLRIPLADTVILPVEEEVSGSVSTELAAAPAETLVTEQQWVPEAVGGVDVGWAEPANGPVFAADVPAFLQTYSLSCEYAAAYIATAGFGWGVPESAFVERVGQSLNPHRGYRGDIYGAWGGTDDYGIYPEAMVPTLNEFGFVGDVFYGGDAASLTSRIDAGMPVLAWLGYFGDTAWLQEDEGSYLLAPGMHVVTVYGYDDFGVYISNPGRGIYDSYAWGDFLAMWGVLDGMALAVAPM